MNTSTEVKTHIIKSKSEFPAWLSFEQLSNFLHENMAPYEDEHHDVQKGLEYALSEHDGPGGFVVIAAENNALAGAVIVLKTGMTGYIPENLILFACVHPDMRGQGLGGGLIKEAIKQCDGDIKLHVEYDNPAKKLYERLGFTNKYAEMRYNRGKS